MSFLTGSTEDFYKPVTHGDTTAASYWFNWRVLLCALWMLISAAFSLFLIWKYEGPRESNSHTTGEEPTNREPAGLLYDDEMWSPCLEGVHPGWLLGYRVVAFFVLLTMLIIISFVEGGSMFYYYTLWTFTSITIYFGLGSLLSLYGCYEYHHRLIGDKIQNMEIDSELGARSANGSMNGSNTFTEKSTSHGGGKLADIWGYLFQIMFQMNAGAVVLTDSVFWFIFVPILAIKNYNLNVLDINMHTINVVLLIGDAALNCLRFPLFRIGYFFMWTVIYVIFQWILHARVSIWWPYPFLDLSSSFAPLWYIAVALMHFPCYGMFALVIKLKHFLLSRWFPQSYHCPR